MSHAESPTHYSSGTVQRHLCDPEHWDPDGDCVNNTNVGGVLLGYGGLPNAQGFGAWSLVGSGGVNPTVTLPNPSINLPWQTAGPLATSFRPLNIQLTHHWKWAHVQSGHPVYDHLALKGWTHHEIQELVLPSSQHHTAIGNINLDDLVHSAGTFPGATALTNPAFLYQQHNGWAATHSGGGCNYFVNAHQIWNSNLGNAVLNSPQATQVVIDFWQSRVNWVRCMIDKCCCAGCPTFTSTQTAKLGTQDDDTLSTHPRWEVSLGEYLENEFEI